MIVTLQTLFKDFQMEKQQFHLFAWYLFRLCKVIKFTSCLPMVSGSLRIPPPLKLVYDIAEILLKVALKHQKPIKSNQYLRDLTLSDSLIFAMCYIFASKHQTDWPTLKSNKTIIIMLTHQNSINVLHHVSL